MKRLTLMLCVCVGVLWITREQLVCGSENSEKHVLVFGGNGFMGSETVVRLMDEGYKVTVVNRGNWYWDSEERVFRKVVKSIQCDRSHDLDTCDELLEHVDSVPFFDAVIDFSAYSGSTVRDVAIIFGGKVRIYILISTDSIYDVCTKNHDGYTLETDNVRPDDEDERRTLNIGDDYANRKLMAEETTIWQRLELAEGFPFVILRLPDVIGPRDSTYRWWMYQIWARVEEVMGQAVKIPQFLGSYKLSFVYSLDVADMIVRLLSMGPQIQDQAINLAWPEVQTIESLLLDIRGALGSRKQGFQWTDESEKNPLYLYPSVRKGPIDVTKALSLLNWSPTPWHKAFTDTVAFYENAMVDPKFEKQRNEIIQIVTGSVFPDDKMKFYRALEKVYNISLPHFTNAHDEL